jgi:putative flippase GtrA
MMSKMKRGVCQNSKLMEILRFVIVGVISTGVTYGAYYFLMDFTNSSIAFTIAYLIAFVVNFILTTTFTFAVKATAKRGIGFVISNAVNYLLSIGLLNLFIYLGVSITIAPIPMFAITIPTNFFIVRWVMKGIKH